VRHDTDSPGTCWYDGIALNNADNNGF
jgi:hypothetical protein